MLQREQAIFMWTGAVGCLAAATVCGLLSGADLAGLGCLLSFGAGVALMAYVSLTWPRGRSTLHLTGAVVALGAVIAPLGTVVLRAVLHLI